MPQLERKQIERNPRSRNKILVNFLIIIISFVWKRLMKVNTIIINIDNSLQHSQKLYRMLIQYNNAVKINLYQEKQSELLENHRLIYV
jgi:hypothetical protein